MSNTVEYLVKFKIVIINFTSAINDGVLAAKRRPGCTVNAKNFDCQRGVVRIRKMKYCLELAPSLIQLFPVALNP